MSANIILLLQASNWQLYIISSLVDQLLTQSDILKVRVLLKTQRYSIYYNIKQEKKNWKPPQKKNFRRFFLMNNLLFDCKNGKKINKVYFERLVVLSTVSVQLFKI